MNVYAHDDGEVGPHAMDHAPIGVMADHRHKDGEWMVSYRYMDMHMDGNRIGTNGISADEIATTISNPFFGSPMMPPTLRVVPTDMDMSMHMVGAMYGLSDRVTLMGMTSYLSKTMDHMTYRGGMGTDVLGEFTTKTDGIGDSTLGAIIGLDDGQKAGHQINLNVAVSLPTGSTTETDEILTPMGGQPSPRLPYPMQLGSGTYDLKIGGTYFDRHEKLGWGAQAQGHFPLERNNGYKIGDRIEATAWIAFEPTYAVSFSGRLKFVSQGDISGMDPGIMAPVQTANPANHGGETVEGLIGLNLAGQSGWLKGQRLAFELGLPLHRDLNGPQLETDLVFNIGWQKAF